MSSAGSGESKSRGLNKCLHSGVESSDNSVADIFLTHVAIADPILEQLSLREH